MKKIISALICALTIISCENLYLEEINAIHKEMDVLRELIDRANSNVDAMQVVVTALQENDYVTGVTPIVANGVTTGYTIAFSKSGLAQIYHGKDGKDGYTPQISIKKDNDGIYYWTLDGQWMLDNAGKKVRAIGMDGVQGKDGQSGVTPKLKIENGYWYISYDNGATWSSKALGQATGDKGADGDAFFKDVIVSDHEIKFVTYDGEEFVVPRNRKVKLILDAQDGETGILPGKEIVVNYTLENATDETFVTASSNGVYTVRVVPQSKSQGKIYIKAPYQYSDGYINVMVTDGESFSLIKVINFYEEQMSFTNGLEYSVSSRGGTITIPFKTNFNCNFTVNSGARSWLSVSSVSTKASMKNGTLTLNVAANDAESSRSGKITVIPSNSTGDIYEEIVINQASAVFSIEKSKYSAHIDGETLTTLVSSSRGLTIRVQDNATTWLSSNITNLGSDSYRVTTVIQKNDTQNIRSAAVELYSDDGNTYLGKIEYTQAFAVEDELSSMILVVRANMANDFTVNFKFTKTGQQGGGLDCYIDWGDGQFERFQAYGGAVQASHTYEADIPADYTVKISGKVPGFSSASSIKEVKQWGQLGIQTISFSNEGFLHSICDDKHASFHNLTSISFKGCSNLKSIPSGLFTYATSLTNLDNVFSDCKSLSSIPENLFDGCSNLTTVNLTFSGCTGLTSLPEKLFAGCSKLTTLNSTFSGCIGLTSLPEKLFDGCSKLTTLNTTFCGCTGLTSLPERLFDGCPNLTDLSSTFSGCTGLKSIHEDLLKGCTEITSLIATFYGCTNLNSLPENLFKDCSKVTTFESIFNGCTSLTSLPKNLFANCTNVESFCDAFSGCSKLTSLPEDLFKDCINVKDLSSTFSYCRGISTLPENLFKHCPKVTTLNKTFYECKALTSIPIGIFDYNRRIVDFTSTFDLCGKLEGESPYTVIDGVKYHLYERYKNPDEFVAPTSYTKCFGTGANLSDKAQIQTNKWCK